MLTTFGALDGNRLAALAAGTGARLRELGAAGNNVVVSLDSGVHFFQAVVGCWMIGATPVLLDPMVRKELANAQEMTGAPVVIRGAGGLVPIPDGATELIVDDSTGVLESKNHSWPEDKPVVYLFTSGSSGRPALVQKTYNNLAVEVEFLTGLFENPRRVATLAPWCHIFGFINSFLLPLSQGGTCDLSGGISPRTVLERAGEGQLDLIVAVPAIYQVMLRYFLPGGLGPAVRDCRFASSGAPLSASLRRQFEELTGSRLTDLYGSTEAGGVAYRRDDGPWNIQPHVDIRLGEEGHLEVRSPSSSVVAPPGFYRIGDIVELEGNGFRLIGRSDDVVKIGGRRTALDEVQAVVEEFSGVERAAVLAREVRGKQRLVAYVEVRGDDFDPALLKTFVRGRLSDHKVPQVIKVIHKIPLTPAGKIDRPRLELGAQEKK
jgi:acyl-CoA synthetase (AMP-forming)/AMP-acid ligase II